MHILYLHQHFALPSGSTGTGSYEFAKRWVKAGHKVTMICGHYDLGGLEYIKEPQIIDGVRVLIVGAKYSHKMSFLKRVFSFLSFMFFSFIAGLKQKNVDIIFATSTPLTIGIPAMFLKWFKRVPFIFEVRDQWPEIPIELEIIRNYLFKRLLLWLEKRIYLSSSGIVALSPGMKDGIMGVIGDVREIIVAPNSADLDRFAFDVDGSKIRKKFGWDNKFVLAHFGAMGKVNSLEFVILAAEKLKNREDILFALVGDGREKGSLSEKVKEFDLKNVQILPSASKAEMPEYFAACEVSLVIIADYPILEHNSANKFFDSLAAGKPVLLNYSGWQREVLEKAGAGVGCRQGDMSEFIEKIVCLYENQKQLPEMGQNSRKLAEEQFARDLIANNVIDFLIGIKNKSNDN